MLGWHVSVYRQADGGASPATADSAPGTCLAVWQTGLGGLSWVGELVTAGKAVHLGGNGYPSRMTAPAQHLVPPIVDGPPNANKYWGYGPGDIITEKWKGKTVIDRDAIAECSPDEWLLVVAWDES